MGSSSGRARRRRKAQESLEREASHSKQVKRPQPDSDTEEEEDHEILFPPKKRETVVTPPSPKRVLEVPDCGVTSVTSMVKISLQCPKIRHRYSEHTNSCSGIT